MRDENQQLMYNKAELGLLKSVFADNEELIYAVRAVLLQMADTSDWALVRSQVTAPVLELIKRRMLGYVSRDTPLSQLGDLYQTLTQELKVKTVEEMEPQFDAKQIEIDYLNQQFAILSGQEVEEVIKLSSLAVLSEDQYANFVNTTARNYILGFVDTNLIFIKSLAGEKDESPEDQQKRLSRDSSK